MNDDFTVEVLGQDRPDADSHVEPLHEVRCTTRFPCLRIVELGLFEVNYVLDIALDVPFQLGRRHVLEMLLALGVQVSLTVCCISNIQGSPRFILFEHLLNPRVVLRLGWRLHTHILLVLTTASIEPLLHLLRITKLLLFQHILPKRNLKLLLLVPSSLRLICLLGFH